MHIKVMAPKSDQLNALQPSIPMIDSFLGEPLIRFTLKVSKVRRNT